MKNRYKKLLILIVSMIICHLWQINSDGRLFGQDIPQRNVLSLIETVTLTKPGDSIIYDPFRGVLEVLVTTLEGEDFWGNGVLPDTFPQNVTHFSLNNSYIWNAGSITQYLAANDIYRCVSNTVYYFDENLNHIFFHASYLENGDTTHSIFEFPIHYVKPVVEIKAVNANTETDQTIVVNSATNVSFEINLTRSFFTLPDPAGYDKIIALEVYHKETGNSKTLPFPQPVLDSNFIFQLTSIPSILKPGYNSFEFRAKGKCADPSLEEYSETASVTIFYLDFSGLNTELCQEDKVNKLTGIPEGGYFEGDGVMDSTDLYNPSQAQLGNNQIKYYYCIEGVKDSVFKNVYINPAPFIDLSGEREVCSNDYNIAYIIDNKQTGNYFYTWDITGGEPLNHTGSEESLIIHWFSEGTGKIKITAMNQTTNCSSTFEYLVDIDETKAPPPSIMFVYNDNMLVCSDTAARYYIWYRNGEVLNNDTTQVPYYFQVNLNPKPNDVFFVETAIILNNQSCFTRSEPFIYKKFKSLPSFSSFPGKIEFDIYPNPNRGEFSIDFKSCVPGDAKLNIMDCNGRLIINENVFIAPGLVKQLKAGSLNSGIYVLQVVSNQVNHYEKFVIY